MRWMAILLAASSVAAADIPPFLLTDDAARIQRIGSAYVVTSTNGTRTTWRRAGEDWTNGRGARYDATRGWRARGSAARWEPTSRGWRLQGRAVSYGATSLRAGTKTFRRVHDGVVADH